MIMMKFGLSLVFCPWYCPPWFYGADKLLRPLNNLIHPQCQGLWSFCSKCINEVVTHDADKYTPVNLILILVTFVFPFLLIYSSMSSSSTMSMVGRVWSPRSPACRYCLFFLSQVQYSYRLCLSICCKLHTNTWVHFTQPLD